MARLFFFPEHQRSHSSELLRASRCKSDSGDVATKYNGTLLSQSDCTLALKHAVQYLRPFRELQRKNKKTKLKTTALIVEDVNSYSKNSK